MSEQPVIQQLGSLIPWRKHLLKKWDRSFGMSCTQFAEVEARAEIDRVSTNEVHAGLKNSDDRVGSADFEFPAKTVNL
jgi:hypothetical protein